MMIVKNYDKGVTGVIDKYPMFMVTNNRITKELKLNSHKYTEDKVFESFEEFEEYMKNRKDGEE